MRTQLPSVLYIEPKNELKTCIAWPECESLNAEDPNMRLIYDRSSKTGHSLTVRPIVQEVREGCICRKCVHLFFNHFFNWLNENKVVGFFSPLNEHEKDPF